MLLVHMHFPTGAHRFLHLVYQQCYTDGGTTPWLSNTGLMIACIFCQQWLPILGQQFNTSGPMLAQQLHVIWIGYIKVKNGLRLSVINSCGSSNDYGYIISYSL